MILLGKGTPEAFSEAADLLRAAAAEGLAAAQFALGVLAETGASGPVDHAAAAALYKSAAEQGHPQAQFRLGIALLIGRGVATDAFNAETWLRRSALAGEAGAARLMGALYAGEDGNPVESALWFDRAAEAAAKTLP